ncbi:MAG: hypothetical protein GEV12_08555 [Micromonosporaceae bacterium]|nr:hypothetical protein [Micromonosporaceae bacterium]
MDWRLLHRRCPRITPAGLIDTLRLARHLKTTTGNGLAHLVAHHGLAEQINTLAADSQPHRALWDTVAAAVLLTTLIDRVWPGQPTIGELAAAAALRIEGNSQPAAEGQPPLTFE